MSGTAAHRRPELVVLDVNETLSDLAPMSAAFERVGLAGHEAPAWFAGVLRDAFALTCVGENPAFATIAAEAVRLRLAEAGVPDVDGGVDEVMTAFTSLGVHPDVVPGLMALRRAGIRIVTLSNGSSAVAQGLLERAGIADVVERTLSVADAGAWKPHPRAYAYALDACGVASADAMLVAVHPWDVDGAARAGLRTGWLRRRAAGYPSYARPAEVTAGDLVELAALLG